MLNIVHSDTLDSVAPAATIDLSSFDLLLATGLILIAGSVSLILKLKLEKQLLIASIRTIVQLILVGYILRWVFGIESLYLILALGTVMTLAATRAAIKRPKRYIQGATWRAFTTLALTGLLTSYIVTRVIIGVEPWYTAQYVIPLLGMILGNSMTGISLCLDYLLESLAEGKDRIESDLAHGATSWEAAREPVTEAVRRGMIPIINAMTVVGIVALPGMMTGQILAGADPMLAVKYQIMVMFMIAASTSLGCIIIALLVYKHVFSHTHHLKIELIHRYK